MLSEHKSAQGVPSMTLRPGEVPGRAVAVFPFLKTTDAIQLGTLAFRSTDDTSGLEQEDATHVREIADMLFLKDELRVRSASYAMLPRLVLDKTDPGVPELERIQAIVAYCYSAPRHAFGDIFFHAEHASLAIFSPQPVTTFLVRPDHHVLAAGDLAPLEADEWHRVPGYEGRYNFRNPFWVAKGSRLYPPVPHISLNDSQDLAWDIGRAFREGPQHHLLPTLIQEPLSENAKRAMTAIRWYNRANSLLADDSEAVLSLAVGFEALLGLPRDAKTERFIDAVSLLLGRVPRLNSWAVQFYTARSDVAHEGRTDRLRLMPTVQKPSETGPEYQSLVSYGRQIFQLCVGSVLFGTHMAQRSELHDKLTTNQERFELICKILNDTSIPLTDRFTSIDDIVATVGEYRYVAETGLSIETMLGALQVAAKNLLECSTSLDPAIKTHVSDLAVAKRSKDGYEILVALEAWHKVMPKGPLEPRSPEGIMRRLTEIIWDYNFMRYFGMKKERESKSEEG
jgi:hypothetical protein